VSGSGKRMYREERGNEVINGPSGPRLVYVAGRKAGVYLFFSFFTT
jgi:hypothetical protein